MRERQTLNDAEQLRALGSAVGSEIISFLRNNGPSPASEIAKHLGRPAPGLTYHLKRMARLGLVGEAGPRGKRGVAYEAAAKQFVVDYTKKNREELMRASQEAALRLFRISEEEFAAVVETGGVESMSSLSFTRLKGTLNKEDIQRLWELQKEVAALFGTKREPDEETKGFVITISVVPT